MNNVSALLFSASIDSLPWMKDDRATGPRPAG
jgi:hypothetical protein